MHARWQIILIMKSEVQVNRKIQNAEQHFVQINKDIEIATAKKVQLNDDLANLRAQIVDATYEATNLVNNAREESTKILKEVSTKFKQAQELIEYAQSLKEETVSMRDERISYLEKEYARVNSLVNASKESLKFNNELLTNLNEAIKKTSSEHGALREILESKKNEMDDVHRNVAEHREIAKLLISSINADISQATKELERLNKEVAEESARAGSIAKAIAEREEKCTEREHLVDLWARRISGILKDNYGSEMEL